MYLLELRQSFVAEHIYSPITGQRQTLSIGQSALFRCNDYFVIGGILTCLEASKDPIFFRISSNFCPLNLLLVGNHQAQIIIAKRLIQGTTT